MIESIRIRNFKSLGEISINLAKFNCLIGMNGAGKSTVLQAFDFLSHLMLGDVRGWLVQRGWDAGDLNCKLRSESNIRFEVVFTTSDKRRLTWSGVFNRQLMRCSGEEIIFLERSIFRSNSKRFLSFDTGAGLKLHYKEISFKHEGSLLSALKNIELSPGICEFRDALQGIRSLELLSPHLLRKRARVGDDIGTGGEKLSAFLGQIKGKDKQALVELLKKFYPTLLDFKVASLRSGWKKLSVTEQFGSLKLETDATHMNDGLLRILAVLAQSSTPHSLVLLDEIENGINQEIIETLVDTLVASPQQMLVTTHSPLILNYLTDEVARDAVLFIYKTPEGESKIRRFFDISRMGKKLRSMGPGDAFVDTDLKAFTLECMEQDARDAQADAQ